MEGKPWLEYKRCGKARCRACPHGPYWYGRRGGRRVYLGKNKPAEITAAARDFDPVRGDIGQACIYLSVGLWMGHREVSRVYQLYLANVAGKTKREFLVRQRLHHCYETVCAWHEWTPGVVGTETREGS